MTEEIRVLLIDDDGELGALLTRYLAGFGCRVSAALTPSEGMQRLRREGTDIVLLDVMLPEKDGFKVCREIKAARDGLRDVPVIMLTARGEVIDRVVGLELGADDYVTKPFEPRELLARIRSVLRRSPDAPARPLPPEQGVYIEREAQRVWVDRRAVELTGMEWQLLALLSSEPGRMFSREDILDEVMGIEADVYSRAVDALISRLRAKLGDTAKTPRFIKTIWGRGYVFLNDHQDPA